MSDENLIDQQMGRVADRASRILYQCEKALHAQVNLTKDDIEMIAEMAAEIVVAAYFRPFPSSVPPSTPAAIAPSATEIIE